MKNRKNRSFSESVFQSKLFRLALAYFCFAAVTLILGMILFPSYFDRTGYPHQRLFKSNAVVALFASDSIRITPGKKKRGKSISEERIAFTNASQYSQLDPVSRIPESDYQLRFPTAQTTLLDDFYRQLTRNVLKHGNHNVKMTLFGDSVIAGDIFPSALKRRWEAYFGNGGPGFVCVTKPYRYYFNNSIKWEPAGDWRVGSVFDGFDGRLGINGFYFIGSNGAQARFEAELAKGQSYDRLNLHYLAYPGGGKISLLVGSNKYQLNTHAKETNSGCASIPILDSAPVQIVCKDKVCLYGMEFIRTNVGMTMDVFPIQGANTGHMLKIPSERWQEQMEEFMPDMAIVMYDINLYASTNMSEIGYKRQVAMFIDRIRSADPELPVLMVSPMAKAVKSGRAWSINPGIARIIRMQAEVCAEKSCAFIDLVEALGGEDSLPEWYAPEPGKELLGDDQIHLSHKGADRLAETVFRIIMSDYKRYLARKDYFQSVGKVAHAF